LSRGGPAALDPLDPFRLADLHAVPLARGQFDRLFASRGVLVAAGWLHAPGEPADSYALYVDSVLAAVAPPLPRPDVRASFPHAIADESVGFLAAAKLEGGGPRGDGVRRVEVVAFAAGRPVGRQWSAFAPGFADGLDDPPERLVVRVTNNPSLEEFRLGGLRTAGVVAEALERHGPREGPGAILDWGCGCGRVAALLLRRFGTSATASLTGCDIDAEAVDWCARHLRGGRFVAIGPDPPTPFAAGEFGAVYGYSVMTHLDRRRQIAWLRELRRVLAPRGLALVTVHGESAARYAARQDLVASLAERGIVDEIDDLNLSGVAPEGYYRETYQSRAWTERAFGAEMEVVEYVERAIGGFQDLVVMRR
jgi:SAM-dependent methyltransferase